MRRQAYDEVFDIYFQRDEFAGKQDVTEEADTPTSEQDPFSSPSNGAGGDGMGGQGGQSLGSLLEDDNRAALATAVEQAAREAGLENIRFFTQKNLYARRILDRMGLRALEREMEAMRQAGTPQALNRAQLLGRPGGGAAGFGS